MNDPYEDVIRFVKLHCTDKKAAMGLYEVYHPECSLDIKDIELPGHILLGRRRDCIHFAYYVKGSIVCCCAYSARLTSEMAKDAEAFRLLMLSIYAKDHYDDDNWPVKIEQMCMPASNDATEYLGALSSGKVEDEEMKRVFEAMILTFKCNRIEGDIPEDLKSAKRIQGRIINLKDLWNRSCRRRCTSC